MRLLLRRASLLSALLLSVPRDAQHEYVFSEAL
jgi:hypothetical protein